jgi:hypothetical protein
MNLGFRSTLGLLLLLVLISAGDTLGWTVCIKKPVTVEDASNSAVEPVKDESGNPVDPLTYKVVPGTAQVTLEAQLCDPPPSETAECPAGTFTYTWKNTDTDETLGTGASITIDWDVCKTPLNVKVIASYEPPSNNESGCPGADTQEDSVQVNFVVDCPKITSGESFTMGTGDFQVQIGFSDPEEDLEPLEAEAGEMADYCHYRAMGIGSVTITTGNSDGFVLNGVQLSHCDIDFYKKRCPSEDDPQKYRRVTLSWSDDETGESGTGIERFGLRFKVYNFSATFDVDADGNLSIVGGSVMINVGAEQDVVLGSAVYLAGDLDFDITYAWNGTSWTDGNWSFDGAGTVDIQVRLGQIATMAYGSITIDGSVGTATLGAVGPPNGFGIAGFRLDITNVALTATFDLKNETWSLSNGTIALALSPPKPASGTLNMEFRWGGGAFTALVKSDSPLKAFNIVCDQLALSATLVPATLEFTEVAGSVRFKPDGFETNDDNGLSISFQLKDGKLTQFTGSGDVTYKKFSIHIASIAYNAGNYEATPVVPAKLTLTASMSLGWQGGAGAVNISDFTIMDDGTITLGSISASVALNPVSVSFSATFAADKFAGTFNGQFGGNVGINGTVEVGSQEAADGVSFNYGFFSLTVNVGPGVPLGPSGLKLLAINGAFGFNYIPSGAPVAAGTSSGPNKDSYYFAGGITIGDVAQLSSLNGTVAVTMQPGAVSVQISGTVQVTQSINYFTGNLTVNYTIGGEAVTGSMTTSVKIPASGSIVSINNNTVNFSIGSPANRYQLSGSNLGGTFFGFLNITGGLNLGGSLSDPIGSMTGNIDGNLTGSSSANITWPDGFKPFGNGSGYSCSSTPGAGLVSDCSCADATDNWAGWGFSGGYDLTASGYVAANLDENGTTGTFGLNMHFSGYVGVKWTCFVVCGSGCSKTQTLTANAYLQGEKSGDDLRITGTAWFTNGSGDTDDAQIDVTL